MMSINSRFKLYFTMPILLLLFSAPLYLVLAQSVDEAFIKSEFPDASSVFLKKSEHLSINYADKKWAIQRDIQEERYFLENAGQVYAGKSIYFSGFEEIKDINARTFVPVKKGKKTKYKTVEVTSDNIETKDVMTNGIFYSDSKEKAFVFPAVQPGAITALSYTEIKQHPQLLGAYYFNSYEPVLESSFSVSFPKNVELSYKLLGQNTENIEFEQKTDENGLTRYTWRLKNLKEAKPEANAPSAAYYMPHVVVYINKGVDESGQEEKVIEDVSGLYGWYSSLVTNINQSEDEQLKTIVNELIQDVSDKKEQVKRIYHWVQSNIKYIAFEDGFGGFVPREAGDVCNKKYGDCKDMSSIMTEMLKIAGTPAYLTWIGTRDKPYSYLEVPTPVADNHMIACVKLDGEYIFLDATGEYTPFGYPTSMIQGKEALIGLDAQNYEIAEVPVIPKEKNTETEQIELYIEGRNLKGKAQLELNGYKKVFAEYARLRVEANSDKEAFFNAYLSKGSNKCAVSHIEEEGFFTPQEKAEINYDFEIPGYVTKAGGKMYVNLNLHRNYEDMDIDTSKRKLAREFEYRHIESYETTLNLPEGATLSYLPEDKVYEGKDFGFRFTYSEEKGKIKVKQEVYIDLLLLEQQGFSEWNEMIQQLNEAYQEVVVLAVNE